MRFSEFQMEGIRFKEKIMVIALTTAPLPPSSLAMLPRIPPPACAIDPNCSKKCETPVNGLLFDNLLSKFSCLFHL
jgi:hypothetical protein